MHDDPGGLLRAYRDRFVRAHENGKRVVIDGACLSACTLAVGLLPPGRVCVTPQAVLGFQAAWTPPPLAIGRLSDADKIPSPKATQYMMTIYLPNQHGGLTPKMIFLKSKELATIVPRCTGSE